MRVIALFLLAVNIGFFAWVQNWLPWLPWQPEQYQPLATAIAHDSDIPRLLMVGEELPAEIPPEQLLLADTQGILTDTTRAEFDEFDEFGESDELTELSEFIEIEPELPAIDYAEEEQLIAIQEEIQDFQPEEYEADTTQVAQSLPPVKPVAPVSTLATTPPPPPTITPERDYFASFLVQLARGVSETFNQVSQKISSDINNLDEILPLTNTPAPQAIQTAQTAQTVQTVQTVKIASAKKILCYEIGPYASMTDLNLQADWFKRQSANIQTSIETKTINHIDKVRVYIAPNPALSASQQQQIAQNIATRLKHEGVNVHIMSTAAMRNSVSLGLYDSRSDAQKVADLLTSRAYANVKLKNYYKSQQQHWLIAKLEQSEQAIINRFPFKQVLVKPKPSCN